VNLKRIAADGVELAEYLCRHLGKKKIILFGHSWGSLVGVTAVRARPDLFAAYVGSGQVESWAANVQGQFDIMLAAARAANDTATVQMLEAIGTPDPKDTHQYFTFTRTYRSYWAKPDQDWVTHLREQAQALKGDKDFEDDENGQLFTDKIVLPDQVASDLSRTATEIDTAFFVIQGRDDRVTVTAAAVDYFNKVQAPAKELVLIPDAGHFAFMTAGDAFLAALTDKVRPVAIARGA
jgi:pimeloyl-ACP methyl ester carboxylesterase